MRHIGLDLALTTDHKAVVMDEQARTLTTVLRLGTSAVALELLFQRAREGAIAKEPLVVVMERNATSLCRICQAAQGARGA